MCECTDQLNQVMDKLRAMEVQLAAIDDNTAEVHEFTTEMGKVLDGVKTMFSEDNIMSLFSGAMGGGGILPLGG